MLDNPDLTTLWSMKEFYQKYFPAPSAVERPDYIPDKVCLSCLLLLVQCAWLVA